MSGCPRRVGHGPDRSTGGRAGNHAVGTFSRTEIEILEVGSPLVRARPENAIIGKIGAPN
jgi:hypothetical protein